VSDFTRRELLRIAAALGVSPMLLGLTGCDDGGDGEASPQGGAGGEAPPAGGEAPPVGGMDDGPPPDDGFERYAYDGDPGPEDLFQHGVASGDPLTDAVILWTRATTADGAEVEVFWEISDTPNFRVRANVGTALAAADRDFTVKVDADGLAPGATYYYRFSALGRTSDVGRTRTAPAGPVDRLRFAVVSCSNMGHGWFHVYQSLAEQADFDAVLHLGDYIYEYRSGGYGNARPMVPEHEIITLEDYRTRYASYRLDPMLAAVHRQHPFICVWDDHETANNSWSEGAANHDPDTEGSWADRRAAAERAYAEWIPIREADDGRIFRTLKYGDLVDLIMLDTRLWGRVQEDPTVRFEEERTLLGLDQEAWLDDQLADSQATWRLVGQQVMLAQLKSVAGSLAMGGGNILNADQWDGYEAARQRLYDTVEREGVEKLVVLTGDIHSSWANELTRDPNDPAIYDAESGAGVLGVEFVTPAVTSPGLAGIAPGVVDFLKQQNPHIKWVNTENRGYIALDITPERVQAAWFHMDRIDVEEGAEESLAKVFETGGASLSEVDAAAGPRDDAPPLAD
jgi:alkaline phosphatase D